MFDSSDRLWTVADCRARLPFKISDRALRRKLRDFGRIVEHRNQIALNPEFWPDFLETFQCSDSKRGPIRPSGRSSVRALTPESACERARELIAKGKRNAF